MARKQGALFVLAICACTGEYLPESETHLLSVLLVAHGPCLAIVDDEEIYF
jgi:hypothetical protein